MHFMGEGVIITYETLFDLLRREKGREELQELDADFYKQVTQYLKEKHDLLASHGDEYQDEAEKTRIQIVNIKKIIKELYERRERKIVNLAMYKSRINNKLLDTRTLLSEERLLFEGLVQELTTNREHVLSNILSLKLPSLTPITRVEQKLFHEEHTEKEEPEKEDPQEIIKVVRFLNPVPKFLGTELEIYGPFEEEEVASLPSKIADVLIDKGRAEEIAK
jgi:DNA replication initiation complex subunit (GINS family)